MATLLIFDVSVDLEVFVVHFYQTQLKENVSQILCVDGAVRKGLLL